MVEALKMSGDVRQALLYCWLWNKPVHASKIRPHTGLFVTLNKQLYPRTPFSFRNPLVTEAIEGELRRRPDIREAYNNLTAPTIDNLRKVFGYIKDRFEDKDG